MESETGFGDVYPRSTTATQADEVKKKASELTRTARGRAMAALDGHKEQLSGLLEKMADTMQDDRVGAYAADYARRGADYLRTRSADDLFSSVRAELRARPGVLLSACFIAGLGIARVMKR